MTPACAKQPKFVSLWPRILLLILASGALFVLFSGEIRDTDFYWHLKTGQRIWQTQSLPSPDPFSFTTGRGAGAYAGENITRQVNLTHEWLAQVIIYLIYSFAGIPGIISARIIVLESFCALVGYIVVMRTRDFNLSVAGALAAAGMAFYFGQSRPFLATLLFAAVAIAVLELRRWVWLLPFIFVVWANCHGGFIVGWIVCSVYAADALVSRLRGKPLADERPLLITLAVSVAASALNPNGWRVLQALVFYRSSGIQTDNLEWQRPIFWQPDFYSVLLFGSLGALLLAWRSAKVGDWLLYLSFAAFSLLAVRNTIFIGLIAPVVIATCLCKFRIVRLAALPVASIALFFCGIRTAVASGNVLAFRSAEWQFPVGAADFIAAHQLKDRMFNAYEAGGYLMWRLWPDQRTFIDGRALSEEAYSDYKAVLYGEPNDGAQRERVLAKYDIQMLVLPGFDYLSGQVFPIAIDLAMSHGSEWRLVYADATGFIFMRHPAAVLTLGDAQSRIVQSLEAQCQQHLEHDPLHPRCAFGLGELYAHLQNQGKARQWLDAYLTHRTGPDPEAERMSQSLSITALNQRALSFEAAGNLQLAETILRQSVLTAEKALGTDDPDTAGSLNNLGSLLEEEGNQREAELMFRQAMSICERTLAPNDPRTISVRDNLAELIADSAGSEQSRRQRPAP